MALANVSLDLLGQARGLTRASVCSTARAALRTASRCFATSGSGATSTSSNRSARTSGSRWPGCSGSRRTRSSCTPPPAGPRTRSSGRWPRRRPRRWPTTTTTRTSGWCGSATAPRSRIVGCRPPSRPCSHIWQSCSTTTRCLSPRRGRRRGAPLGAPRRGGGTRGRSGRGGHPHAAERLALALARRTTGRALGSDGVPPRRDAAPRALAPGGDVVTTTRTAPGDVEAAVGLIPDPEVPVLTIADLGILRSATADEARSRRRRHHADLLRLPRDGGDRRTRVACMPRRRLGAACHNSAQSGWTTDWMSEEGKEKLRRFGIAPPTHTRAEVRSRSRWAGARWPAPGAVGGHGGAGPVRVDGVQSAAAVRGVRDVRRVQDPLTCALLAPAPQVRRPRFHLLTVAGVERLTDEAVAVTFEVPHELWDEYAYSPGQHLTLRATIDGEDVRQSYSICQPRSGRGGRGGGAWRRRWSRAGGCRRGSQHLGHGRRRDRGDDADGVVHLPDPADGGSAPRRDRRGWGITPVISPRHGAGGGAGLRVTLLFGNRRTSTVMFLEELEDLEEPVPGPVPRARLVARTAGRRAVPRPATRSGRRASWTCWFRWTASTSGTCAVPSGW